MLHMRACIFVNLHTYICHNSFDVLYYYQLHYLRLPKDIADSYVMLMDATVATGAAAMMAIRILLDHDVPESNIMLLSLIMAEAGENLVEYTCNVVQ